MNRITKKKADEAREPVEELTTADASLEDESIPELEPAVEPAPDDCGYCADFGETHKRNESARRKCFAFTPARLLPKDGVPLWCPRRGAP